MDLIHQLYHFKDSSAITLDLIFINSSISLHPYRKNFLSSKYPFISIPHILS
jgi:hypothetical protein